MLWAVTLCREWWYGWCSQAYCPPAISLSNIEKGACLVKVYFQSALCSFVNEVCQKDAKEFPGETIKQIMIMLQLYLEKQGVNLKLIDDPDMARFHNTLDNVMKRCAAEGLGHKESSMAIDLADENVLWENNILGNSEPDQLWETVFFLLGVNFTLRGEEHKNLHILGFDSQLLLGKDRLGEWYLEYREDVKGKTHQGGLSNKVKPQTLCIYGSTSPSRNVINLFTQYI